MTGDDLAGVGEIHRVAFQGFFLDRMGPAFLRGYYAAVLRFDGSVALVAEDSSRRAIGFVVGFLDPPRFYSYFRLQRWCLLPAILVALLRRPLLLTEILRNTSRVRQEADVDEPTQWTAELASIGSAVRGGGTGSALIQAFVEAMAKRGCRQIRLTTDEAENEKVRAFYRKHGFRELGKEQRGDRTLIVYAMDLAGGDAAVRPDIAPATLQRPTS